MKNLTKYKEELVFEDPRKKCVDISYADENGNHVLTHTVFRSKPSVAVIVYKDSKIALIRQFRTTTGQCYIEIPAGGINDGESEIEAAIRETREETGLIVENAIVLVKGPSLLDPSKSDENYGVAVANVIDQKGQSLDENEQIDSEIIWMDESEVFRRVRAQLFEGEKFYEDLFMSGHSMYALMAYMMSR